MATRNPRPQAPDHGTNVPRRRTPDYLPDFADSAAYLESVEDLNSAAVPTDPVGTQGGK